MYKIFFAPLQGYTDSLYRRVHHDVVGGVAAYFSPFVRVEKGGIRNKDNRDLAPENNEGVCLIPQIIVSDADEMCFLCDFVQEKGYSHINVNMGCPAPMQTRMHRGSGLLIDPERLAEIAKVVEERKEVNFSVKMRLGMDSADDWRNVLPVMNDLNLEFVVLHPRIAAQQYKGEVNMEAFDVFNKECRCPLVFNGDVNNLQRIKDLECQYPHLVGVMLGRGLLGQPSLSAEYLQGEEWTNEQRFNAVRRMHDRIFEESREKFKGDSQLLLHMHTFWEYQQPYIEKKVFKKIMKSGSLRNYLSAVENLW